MILNANQCLLAEQIAEFGDQIGGFLQKKQVEPSEKENAEMEIYKLNKSVLDETINISTLVKKDIPRQLEKNEDTLFKEFP